MRVKKRRFMIVGAMLLAAAFSIAAFAATKHSPTIAPKIDPVLAEFGFKLGDDPELEWCGTGLESRVSRQNYRAKEMSQERFDKLIVRLKSVSDDNWLIEPVTPGQLDLWRITVQHSYSRSSFLWLERSVAAHDTKEMVTHVEYTTWDEAQGFRSDLYWRITGWF